MSTDGMFVAVGSDGEKNGAPAGHVRLFKWFPTGGWKQVWPAMHRPSGPSVSDRPPPGGPPGTSPTYELLYLVLSAQVAMLVGPDNPSHYGESVDIVVSGDKVRLAVGAPDLNGYTGKLYLHELGCR